MSLDAYKEFPFSLPVNYELLDCGSNGYVYVIGFEEAGIVKIGSAMSVGSRLAELQVGNPFELRLLAAVSIYEAQPAQVELAAHKIAKAAGAHIRGEWFELEVDEALKVIIDAAKSKRARYGPWAKAVEASRSRELAVITANEEDRKKKLRCKLGMD